MEYAIIDIGSNTMCLSIFEVTDGRFHRLLDERKVPGLAGYHKNGKLTQAGVDKVCSVLGEYQNTMRNLGVENHHAYATAAIRDASNSKSVVKSIKKETGMDVEVLSGEEAARLEFLGAMEYAQQKKGLMIDIGGGSTEIVSIKKKEMTMARSFDAGSLNTYLAFVGDLFPTEEEQNNIAKYFTRKLDAVPGLDKLKFDTIVGVGGSIRALHSVLHDLDGDPGCSSGKCVIKAERIHQLLKKFTKDPAFAQETLLRSVPDRLHTFMPGMVILRTMIDYFGATELMFSDYGAREGALIDRVVEPAREEAAKPRKAAPAKKAAAKPAAKKAAAKPAAKKAAAKPAAKKAAAKPAAKKAAAKPAAKKAAAKPAAKKPEPQVAASEATPASTAPAKEQK